MPEAITVYYGVMAEPARHYLDSLWTDNPRQVERGYCVGAVSYNVQRAFDAWGRFLGKEVIARVWTVLEPDSISGQTPSAIDVLRCPAGHQHIHTHPPTTCTDDEKVSTCVYGGTNAWQCQPSRVDLMVLVASGDRFGVIQCDRRAFRFYWPSEYRPS